MKRRPSTRSPGDRGGWPPEPTASRSWDQRQWLSALIFFSGLGVALLSSLDLERDGERGAEAAASADGAALPEAGLRRAAVAAAPPPGADGGAPAASPATQPESRELPELPEGPAARLLRGELGPPAPAFGVGTLIPGQPRHLADAAPPPTEARPIADPEPRAVEPAEDVAWPWVQPSLEAPSPEAAVASPARRDVKVPPSALPGPPEAAPGAPPPPPTERAAAPDAALAALRSLDALEGVSVLSDDPDLTASPPSEPVAPARPAPPEARSAEGDAPEAVRAGAPDDSGSALGAGPHPEPAAAGWPDSLDEVFSEPAERFRLAGAAAAEGTREPPEPVPAGRALPSRSALPRRPELAEEDDEIPAWEGPDCARAISLAHLRMSARRQALDHALGLASAHHVHLSDVARRVRAHWHHADAAHRLSESLGAVATAFCDPDAPLPRLADIAPASAGWPPTLTRIAPVVAIFKNMKPKPAAAILDRWPPALAASVLDGLPPRVAAPIAGAMTAPKAGLLTRSIADGDTLGR